MAQYAEFARWLRVQLAQRGWKQVDLARETELLGEKVTQTTVSKWARGLTQPTRENCAMLAQIFEMPVADVLELTGYPILDDPILPGLSRRLGRLPEEARKRIGVRIEEYANSLLALATEEPRRWVVYDEGRGYVSDRDLLRDLVERLSAEDVEQFLALVRAAVGEK